VTVKEGGETKAKASQAAPTSGSLVADFDGSAKKVMSCKDAQERTCGAKCAAAGELENIAKNAGFSAPQGCAIPFGVQIQAAERSQKEYEKLCNEFDAKASDGSAAESLAEKVRNLIKKEWKVDDSVVKDIQASVSSGSKVMVRSSANCEDLQKMSGAGLYDSIANVDSSNAGSVAEAVSLVWQSLWTKRAAQSRKAAGMKHSTAVMGVLVQKMVSPTFAFIAFSDNPISRDAGEVYIEMCVGMGETLASAGQPGTPYRFSYSKADKKVTTMALSSFSKALVPQGNSFQLASEQIDYSDIAIHTDSNLRDQVVEKIAQAVMAIAKERGSAQDVEGAIDAEGVMHIVQARPMVLSDD
jgi:phosphoglucan,water dikinase